MCAAAEPSVDGELKVSVSGLPVQILSARPFGFSGWWSGWFAPALVAAGGVEGECSEDFVGGGVDDADVEVADEQDDAGSGVGSADSDVVHAAVDT